VRTHRVKFVVYALSGLIASVAGIVSFSRFVSAEPASGFGAELDVIAAALAGIITNGVVLLNIHTYAQQVITGCVILIAVSIDIWRVRPGGR
jgi:ribose transport system permease protein